MKKALKTTGKVLAWFFGLLFGFLALLCVVTLIWGHMQHIRGSVTENLPVTPAEFERGQGPRTQLLMEPGPAALLKAVMPDYLAGVLYGAVCDAVACEMAARRNAMDSATKNAEQMISDLSLSYNRARQGSITQEITEIVAGAEQ